MSFLPSAILRAVPGAFIVNAAVGKFGSSPEKSAGLQQFAATGIPALKKLPSDQFANILAGAELAVGGALFSPFTSNRVAGAALASFGAGLLTMYFRNPNMTLEDGIRPSEEGLQLSKNIFLVAIGAALVTMDCSDRRAKRKLKKIEDKLDDAA